MSASPPQSLTMTIMLGLPGAGKSTYVKHRFSNPEPKRLVICMDDLRKAFGHEYKEDLEPLVLNMARALAIRALIEGFNVIIDESVTSLETASKLTNIAKGRSAKVEMVELMTPCLICRERRMATGFSGREFDRKAGEWYENKATILALGDRHIQVTQEVQPLTATEILNAWAGGPLV